MRVFNRINSARKDVFDRLRSKKEHLVRIADEKKEVLVEKYRNLIREKAIDRVKSRLTIAGKKITDIDEEGLEHLVKEEEEKLIAQFKKSGALSLLAFLGITT